MVGESENRGLIKRNKFKFHRLGQSLITLAAGSGNIWLGLSDRQLLWYSIDSASTAGPPALPHVEEVSVLPQLHPEEEISKMFSSQSGAFCLVTTTFNNAYICSTSLQKAGGKAVSHSVRPINSLKGRNVASAAWPAIGSEKDRKVGYSGPVLLGTESGDLLEIAFGSHGVDNFTKVMAATLPGQYPPELYCETLYKLNSAIVGLHYSKANLSDMADGLYCVVAATANGSLIQFVEIVPSPAAGLASAGPILKEFFRSYPNPDALICATSPPASIKQTPLAVYHSSSGSAQQLVWLAAHGIYASQFDFANSLDSKMVLTKQKLMRNDKTALGQQRASGKSSAGKIIGVAVGEFHAVAIHEHSIVAVNLLSERTVEEDNLLETTTESILGSDIDPLRHTVWIWTQNYIFYFDLIDENRDIWRHYLERGEFEKAKKWCGGDKGKLNRVLTETAMAHFATGQYVKGAEFYAESQSPIESVVPDLMALPDNQEALRSYLRRRLELLPKVGDTRLAKTTLILWLIDIYLCQLSCNQKIQNGHPDHDDASDISHNFRKAGAQNGPLVKSTENDLLRKEFEEFLTRRDVIDALTSLGCRRYDLLLSHGDRGMALKVAECVHDWSTYCDYLNLDSHFADTINAMKQCCMAPTSSKEGGLLLRSPCFSVVLHHLPTETLSMLKEVGAVLRPSSLVMTLVQLELTVSPNSPVIMQIIEYLEFCVEKLTSRDASLHNYLLSLYAKTSSDRMISYLKRCIENEPKVPFDVDFAITCCERSRLQLALILLYPLAGRFEEAIEAAFTVSKEEAKRLAVQFDEQPPSAIDLDTRKRIWLTVAERIVNENQDIATALEIVHECKRVIGIEDIMPFFSDAVTIDQFKDAILTSLQDFKTRVKESRDQLENCAKSAEQMARDLIAIRQVPLSTSSSDRCSICRCLLHVREFYVFPCGHNIHRQCAFHFGIDMAVQTSAVAKRLDDLWARLPSATTQQVGNTYDQVDKILGGECPLCGDVAVRSIDTPFISQHQLPTLNSSWV